MAGTLFNFLRKSFLSKKLNKKLFELTYRILWCIRLKKTDPSAVPCSTKAFRPTAERWCRAAQMRRRHSPKPWKGIYGVTKFNFCWLFGTTAYLHTLPRPTDNEMHDKRNSMSFPHFSFSTKLVIWLQKFRNYHDSTTAFHSLLASALSSLDLSTFSSLQHRRSQSRTSEIL